MYSRKTYPVTCLTFALVGALVCFALLVGSGSASGAADALFPELGGGEASGSLVMDETIVIEESASIVHVGDMMGYTLTSSDVDGYETILVPLNSLYFNVMAYPGTYLYQMPTAPYSGGPSIQRVKIVDASGTEYNFELNIAGTASYNDVVQNYIGSVLGTSANVYGYKTTDSRYVEAYLLDYNPFESSMKYSFNGVQYDDISNVMSGLATYFDNAFSVTTGRVDISKGSGDFVAYALVDGSYYVGFKSFSMTPSVGSYSMANALYLVPPGSTSQVVGKVTAIYEESSGFDNSQRLYILKDDESKKYYLWLFRNGFGSSLILEGEASASLPLVTITNGGRYYTDNFFTSLDMYDAFGVPYEYSIQISAFNSDNQVVKKDYTFTVSSQGGSPDDFTPILPPGIIEIPDIIGGIVTEPGELPKVNLPFDFTAPVFAVDFTSGFSYAFNNSWLGVSDVYQNVESFIDSVVITLVPDLSGVFGSIVYTVETYADAFTDTCRDLRNTYAVPFYNLFVKFSSVVPGIVWIVFDVWLFYCCARLIVWVFTCPLSDVIKRWF